MPKGDTGHDPGVRGNRGQIQPEPDAIPVFQFAFCRLDRPAAPSALETTGDPRILAAMTLFALCAKKLGKGLMLTRKNSHGNLPAHCQRPVVGALRTCPPADRGSQAVAQVLRSEAGCLPALAGRNWVF